MRWTFAATFVTTVIVSGACSTQQPVAPLASLATLSQNPSAKPGAGPSSSTHDLTVEASIFGDPGFDGLPSPGHIEASTPAVGLQGWITGPTSSGWYKASATGAYTLSITDVSDIPGVAGDPCTEAQQDTLRSSGVLGAPVSGSFSLTIDEDTTGNVQAPRLSWQLANVSGVGGFTWVINGRSGSVDPRFFPQFDPNSSATALMVTVEDSVVDFSRYPTGARKPDLLIGKCRTDFTMRMTKRQ